MPTERTHDQRSPQWRPTSSTAASAPRREGRIRLSRRSPMKTRVVLVASLLLLPAAALAQHTLAMHTHSGANGSSACKKGRFDRPIELYPPEKIGHLKHPVNTEKPEAQDFFNQGLTFFYGFDSESAMRSFHQAAVKDSELAMAYWGVALAAGGDVN